MTHEYVGRCRGMSICVALAPVMVPIITEALTNGSFVRTKVICVNNHRGFSASVTVTRQDLHHVNHKEHFTNLSVSDIYSSLQISVYLTNWSI